MNSLLTTRCAASLFCALSRTFYLWFFASRGHCTQLLQTVCVLPHSVYSYHFWGQSCLYT